VDKIVFIIFDFDDLKNDCLGYYPENYATIFSIVKGGMTSALRNYFSGEYVGLILTNAGLRRCGCRMKKVKNSF